MASNRAKPYSPVNTAASESANSNDERRDLDSWLYQQQQ